jgi:uncharacterized protein
MPAADAAGAAGRMPETAGAAGAPREGEVTVPYAGIIRRDERSAPFFDAAAKDQLLIRRCAACGRWLAPEAGACYDCGAEDPGWVPASGLGTLVSWAVQHPRGSAPGQPSGAGAPGPTGGAGAPGPTGQEAAPTVLALVELDEGPWLHTGLAVTGPAAIAALRAGQQVAASFVHPADGESYPVFCPAPDMRPGD